MTCRALYETFSLDMIVRLARIILPGYDINERTGIQENIPITAQMAAEQVIRDLLVSGEFLRFIELLISVDERGFMGRVHRIQRLRELVKTVLDDGYNFDRATGLFIEDADSRASPDWGRLIEGEEHPMALLRLDIARNSQIVKDNHKDKVNAAYESLRNIVAQAVVSRKGRVWYWEGDGCLCGFLFAQKEKAAILAGMEILHELFLFNRLANPLESPLRVRIAAHAGPVRFSTSPGVLRKNESVREIGEIESRGTPIDGLGASANLFLSLDRMIQDRFRTEVALDGLKVRQYSILMEKA